MGEMATVGEAGALPERMRRAAQRAGVEPGDPLMALVEAMAEAAGAARLLTPAAEDELVRRVSVATAAVTERVIRERARASERATALVGAMALALALLLGAGLGWWFGRAQPVPTPWGTMSPAAVEVLARNDLGAALAACSGPLVWTDRTSGRRACSVPLWLDAPPLPGR